MTRRAVLGVLAAGALAGCARANPEPTTSSPSVPGADAATLPAGVPSATPGAGPTATLGDGVAGPGLPSRDSILTRHGRAAPTAWGLAVPGVVGTLGPKATAARAIALTFDACGGPRRDGPGCGVDEALLAVLRRHDVRATFFLNARWITANPKAFESIAGDARFEIANHGTRHLALSVTGRRAYDQAGTRDPGDVYDEVAGNHELLSRLLGRPPRWFRPGTAYSDDVAVRIVAELGERVVGFSVNGDGGATYTARQGHDALCAAGPGDIVISHVNWPTRHTAAAYRHALPELLARGLRPVTLSEYLAPAAD